MESMLPSLLTRGVKVYYRKGNFAHTKLFLVDDYCAFVGSSNLDMLSLHLNFEFNLKVYNKLLLKELNTHFDGIKADAKRITTCRNKFICKVSQDDDNSRRSGCSDRGS